MKRTPFKQKAYKPLKRSTLRKISRDDTPQCKERIQALLRKHVIKRDGGCVLRHYPEAGACGGYTNDGELILQAEHLNTRSRSVSFGELDNVVCLCKHHHIHWKPQHSQLYWELIKQHIGQKQWAWYKRVRDDHRDYHFTLWDWQKIEIDLTNKLKEYD